MCNALGLLGSALDSGFSTALVGSLAGAFAGAVAAQRIVERSKRREELIRELRNTNAAIMVSFSICNSALALKKQHIIPVCRNYEETRAAFGKYLERQTKGASGAFEYVADFRKLVMPVQPIDTLKDVVFNRVSVHGRPLSLTSVLETAVVGLSEAIKERNQIIEDIKSGTISKEEQPYCYFGFPSPLGHVNQEYPNLMEVIRSQVDDVAFFSCLLCDDLTEHGHEVREEAKIPRKDLPDVTKVSFDTAKQSGLMPSSEAYGDWLKAFSIEH